MKYFKRSVKYFFALCVLCAAIMLLNQSTGMARLTFGETFYVMFHTTRGMLLPVMIVVLALFYPKFGFIVRRVEGSVAENRQQIVNALLASGFSLRSEQDGVMIFRADSIVQRITLLGEDEVKVYQSADYITLDGTRRGVARAAYRLEGYLQASKND